MRGRAAFYDQQLLSYGSFPRTNSAVFWIKRRHKQKIFKNFLSKNKFPQSPKITKKIQLNAMAIDLSQILPKISNISKIRI